MKKHIFFICCSSLFCMVTHAADKKPLPASHVPESNNVPSNQNVVTVVRNAFAKIPRNRQYAILAQLADTLTDDDKKIKLSRCILQAGVTKITKKQDEVTYRNYKPLSAHSVLQLQHTQTIIAHALQEQNTQKNSPTPPLGKKKSPENPARNFAESTEEENDFDDPEELVELLALCVIL